MKEKIIENGIEYVKRGDFYFPNVEVPKKHRPLGVYGRPVSYTHLSVGVRDNARCFDYPVIIRAVNTIDAMTATIEQIAWPVLLRITARILKEAKHVNLSLIHIWT